MCHRLGILRKYKTKTDLLIRITSHVAKPSNKENVKKELPKSILVKLFPHEYDDEAKKQIQQVNKEREEEIKENNELD